MQLTSGNVELINATLGLIATIARNSPLKCRDMFQKLNFSSTTFMNLLQRGKMIEFRYGDETLSINSRRMIISIVLEIMHAADESITSDLLGNNSILRKILSSLPKDSSQTIIMTLDALPEAINRDIWKSRHALVRLIDSRQIHNLMRLYDSNDDAIQESVHLFLRFFINYIADMLNPPKRAFQSNYSSGDHIHSGRGCLFSILNDLSPQSNPRHAEVMKQTCCILSLPFFINVSSILFFYIQILV